MPAGPFPVAGFLPVAGSSLAVNVWSAFGRRTEAELSFWFVTTRSGLPLVVKLALAIAVGLTPTEYTVGAAKVPSPLPFTEWPSRIDTDPGTEPLPWLTTARSKTPSPLRSVVSSATGLPTGFVPLSVVYVTDGVKPPPVLPNKIATLLLVESATAMSTMPSPLKSPTATAEGDLATFWMTVAGFVNVPSPPPTKTETKPSPPLSTARPLATSPLTP